MLRKIADEYVGEKPCRHPEHNPPNMRVYKPGTYEHECPKCGSKIEFTVRGVYLSYEQKNAS